MVNEDPNARIIRELRAEIDALKEMLLSASQPGNALTEKLNENEKLVKEMSLTWEEKLLQTEQKQGDRRHALEKMGISVQSSGIKVEKNKYFLVNLNDDPSLNELLVYYLKERTLVGRPGAQEEQDIQLMGLGIQAEHCILEIEHSELWITPLQVIAIIQLFTRPSPFSAPIYFRSLLKSSLLKYWATLLLTHRIHCRRPELVSMELRSLGESNFATGTDFCGDPITSSESTVPKV